MAGSLSVLKSRTVPTYSYTIILPVTGKSHIGHVKIRCTANLGQAWPWQSTCQSIAAVFVSLSSLRCCCHRLFLFFVSPTPSSSPASSRSSLRFAAAIVSCFAIIAQPRGQYYRRLTGWVFTILISPFSFQFYHLIISILSLRFAAAIVSCFAIIAQPHGQSYRRITGWVLTILFFLISSILIILLRLQYVNISADHGIQLDYLIGESDQF